MHDFTEYMGRTKSEVEKSLSSFLTEKVETSIDPLVTRVASLIKEFTLNGGKRIRPILMVSGYSMFKEPDSRIYNASICTEISQTYFLIQDDIMDQSMIRRGKPAFHLQVLEKLYGNRKDLKHHAESIAIIASDLADSYCHQALLKSGFDPLLLTQADMELSNIFEATGHGQLIDINSFFDDEFTVKDLMRVHLWKTARYTIEGPLRMGAILSGTREKLNMLSSYGYSLGLAFQLHDDLLGLFGDEKVLGKSVKSDINEGKKTLLILKAMENGTSDEREFLSSAIRSGNVSDDEFERVKKIVERTGSLDYSIDLSKKLAGNSKKYIAKSPGRQDMKDFLIWLSDYIIKRSS